MPASTNPVVFRGSCACARTTYTCTAVPSSSTICHCITCRKLSGGAFQAFTDVPTASVTFVDEHEHLTFHITSLLRHGEFVGSLKTLKMSEQAERVSCKDCGTPLAMRYGAEPEKLHLALGAVDEGSVAAEGDDVRRKLRPRSHIFLEQEAKWFGVPEGDGRARYQRFSSGREEEKLIGQ